MTRSADFAHELLAEKGFSLPDIRAVQNMILCTGVSANLAAIPFQSEMERIAGFSLATADLLGQMAADDYCEKLPILYEEFAEAAQHNRNSSDMFTSFTCAEDLIRNTPLFWTRFVLPRLENDFLGLYRFLSRPYPDGPNDYVRRIEVCMDQLQSSIAKT